MLMSVTRRQLAPAAASLAAAVVAAPAIAQTTDVVKWRLVSSYPKSLDTLWGAATTIARVVSELTDGKFQLQPFGAGEIVPGLQVLDAVSNATVECGHTYGGYYIGNGLHLRRLAALRHDAAPAQCLDDVRRRPQADGRDL
jgi:TRAP-type mannitol/chloroaromatic compound transport system substrate-binding protein